MYKHSDVNQGIITINEILKTFDGNLKLLCDTLKVSYAILYRLKNTAGLDNVLLVRSTSPDGDKWIIFTPLKNNIDEATANTNMYSAYIKHREIQLDQTSINKSLLEA